MTDEIVEQELAALGRAGIAAAKLDWVKAAGAYRAAYSLAVADRTSLQLQLHQAETALREHHGNLTHCYGCGWPEYDRPAFHHEPGQMTDEMGNR